MKKPARRRVVRSADAAKYLDTILHAPDKPTRRRAIVAAKAHQWFGRYNEAHGYHARRPKGSSRLNEIDAVALDWMDTEANRPGGETRPYALARLAVAECDIPNKTTEGALLRRLVRKWKALAST